MDYLQKMQLRMQCLDLALQVCQMTNDSYSVISKAQDMWDWLVKDQELISPKNPDDDIPF